MVVVDELADMMMVVGKKVEELIARLAQKAQSRPASADSPPAPSVDIDYRLIKVISRHMAFRCPPD